MESEFRWPQQFLVAAVSSLNPKEGNVKESWYPAVVFESRSSRAGTGKVR